MSEDLDVSEKIILQVRARKCLLDMRCTEYCNKQAKLNAWVEISVNLGLSEDFIKTRWKSLRDRFNKVIKDNKSKSGQAAVRKHVWPLAQSMEFLRDILTARKCTESTTVLGTSEMQDSQGNSGLNNTAVEICETEILDPLYITSPSEVQTLSLPQFQSSLQGVMVGFQNQVQMPTTSAQFTGNSVTGEIRNSALTATTSNETGRSISSGASAGSSHNQSETRAETTLQRNKRKKDEAVDEAFLKYIAIKTEKAKEGPQSSSKTVERAAPPQSSLEQYLISVAKDAENLSPLRKIRLRRCMDDKLMELLEEQEREGDIASR